MAAPTFLDVLRSEVARMQSLHPERLGELARAHALILHGMVLPRVDDPQTGQVLSSDGAKHYTVNGSCDCRAGQHDKTCKHMQAWKLYQFIAKKVEAQPTPPGHEAPASCNVSVMIGDHKVQVTLRDSDEQRMLARLAVVLQQYPLPQAQPAPSQPLTAQQHNGAAMQRPVSGFCAVHNVAMQWNEGRAGRKGWYSHRTDEGWCKGR